MYLRKITLRNIKCFSNIEIDFMSGDNPRLWTAILGQNGLGKSTLLQAIGVALAGPWAVRELLPVAEGWVRFDQPYGEIDAILEWTEGDAQTPKWPKKTPYIAKYIVTGKDPEDLDLTSSERSLSLPPMSIVDWSGEGSSRERERNAKDMSRLKQTAYAENKKEGWLACGYGPFRRLSGGAQAADRILYSGRKSARFVTLFREDAALTDATDWLVSLYNRSRDNDEVSKSILSQITSVFAGEFLPEPCELIVNSHSASLKIRDRSPVSFQDLSDGYRSMLALGIDLLRWIAAAFPESTNLLDSPGVILIDELDAHAHPSWQREVGFWLRKKFPKLQFIVATHSPFLAQVSDEPGGYIVLEHSDNGVIQRDSVESIATWRADQILTEIFDLPTTRSPEVEKKLDRLNQLLQREHRLTPEEREEYKQLKMWSETLPPGIEDLAEKRLASALQTAVDRLKDRIGAIE
ncbi:MAG: AAA family ATPase [Roseiflexaceae bacterium]